MSVLGAPTWVASMSYGNNAGTGGGMNVVVRMVPVGLEPTPIHDQLAVEFAQRRINKRIRDARGRFVKP